MSACSNNLIKVDPGLLSTLDNIPFDLFLRQSNESYILYSPSGITLDPVKKSSMANNMSRLYVEKNQYINYTSVVSRDISKVLQDINLAVSDRQKILQNKSEGIIDTLIHEQFPIESSIVDHVKSVVRESIRRLNNNESLSSVGNLASHDYTTFSHQHNVFVYLITFLRKMNYYKEDVLVDIGVGALMHDIGKQLIDQRIIQKPSRLTDAEFKVIQCHPGDGEKVARSFGLNATSLNCIKYHHERFDGTGYPNKLNLRSIPKYVQALTICDVYDAITSNRPYAKAEDPFSALGIMKDKMAGHFNMDLFKDFVRMLSSNR